VKQAAHSKNPTFPEPKFSKDFKLNFAKKRVGVRKDVDDWLKSQP
jgi:hypothetical protein